MPKTSLFFLFFYLILNNAFAQTATFNPIKDNTIFSDNTTYSNGGGLEFYVGFTGSVAKRRALLQFDLSSIPAGSTITNVTLLVNCTHITSGGAVPSNLVELHKCLSSWGEGTASSLGQGAPAGNGDATWICRFADGAGGCTNAWTTSGGDFSGTVSSSVTVVGTGNYTFPSTTQLISDIQSWVNTPANNNGWILKGDESNLKSARGFESRESTSNATVLTVTYTSACPGLNSWTGSVSTAWEDPGNWSCGTVPNSTTDATINSGTVTINSNVSVHSVNILPGVNFTVNSGFTFTILH